ncbi:MAG: nucleotidyl transferase AbiEii/AbiGii toxin family protein [Spirochaetota bacterium]
MFPRIESDPGGDGNLRDVPRLSVDLDLVYLPIQDRATSLRSIGDALNRISGDVQRSVPDATVRPVPLPGSDETVRLIVASPKGTVQLQSCLLRANETSTAHSLRTLTA